MKESKAPLQYARTESGRVDTAAYVGLDGVITANSLEVNVNITAARIRYGHLDLQVTPKNGTGAVWIERKNISIPNDPVVEVQHYENNFVSELQEEFGFELAEVKEMIRKMLRTETTVS